MPSLEFLRAASAIIAVFDALPGMGMVKKDMIGNVDKIWRHQTSGRKTLQQMCLLEIDEFGAERAARRGVFALRASGGVRVPA